MRPVGVLFFPAPGTHGIGLLRTHGCLCRVLTSILCTECMETGNVVSGIEYCVGSSNGTRQNSNCLILHKYSPSSRVKVSLQYMSLKGISTDIVSSDPSVSTLSG